MINVITDVTQSLALLVWVFIYFVQMRHVRRELNSIRYTGHTRQELKDATFEAMKRAANRNNDEPQAVCGCTHHLCFHDDTGCHFNVVTTIHHPTELEKLTERCGCQRYMGPEHLPTVLP